MNKKTEATDSLFTCYHGNFRTSIEKDATCIQQPMAYLRRDRQATRRFLFSFFFLPTFSSTFFFVRIFERASRLSSTHLILLASEEALQLHDLF